MIEAGLDTKLATWSLQAPDDVVTFMTRLQTDAANGTWPAQLQTMSASQTPVGESSLGRAILAEFHLLLCTKDAKWAAIRNKAGNVREAALMAIVGWVSATLGLALATVLGAASLILSFILSLGTGVFCRLYRA